MASTAGTDNMDSVGRFGRLRIYLQSGVFDPSWSKDEKDILRRKAKSYCLRNGEIFLCQDGKERKLIEDENEKKQLLKCFHESPEGGHAGISATYDKIRSSFFWDGMKKDIKTFVSTCTCQSTKDLKLAQPELQHIKAYEPFDLVGMDLIGPFPETSSGNKYILTLVDYCSKFPDAYPLPSKEATEIARALVDYFCTWGTPKRLLSDQGREFNNKLNFSLCQVYGIERVMSRPYHPQTNGLCERTNRTLKDRLSHVADQSNWDKHIKRVLFSLRTQVHQSTRCTPFKALFGREGRHFAETPKEFHLPDELPLDMDLADLQEVLGALAKKREETVQKANANQDKAHFKQSMAYNKRMNKGAKTFDFQPGQQVYTALETKKGRGKIKRLWQGPERIQSIHDGKFQLENGKTVAKKICKPHFSSSLHSVLPPFHEQAAGKGKQDHHYATVPQPLSDHTYAADPAEGVQDASTDHFDPWLHAPPHVFRKSQHKMVCPGGIDVTPQSLLTLQSPNWLDDSIIQSFLGTLVLRHPKSVALSTFIVEKLPKPEDMSPGWFLPQVQMSALDWILLPIHTADHWLLVVADVTKRQIHILDSIPQVARRKQCFDLWMDFLQRRAEVCPSDLPVQGWEEGNLFSEIQHGFADCGVYLCMNAENMVKCGRPALQVNPPAARRHIFKEVVAHGHLPGEKCDSPICTEPDQESWVQCRCCTARVHTSCTGQDAVVQSHSNTFTCAYCM